MQQCFPWMQVDIDRVDFVSNRAEFGGGVGTEDGTILAISASRFIDNEASGSGGGIYADSETSISIRHSNFSNNNASWGAGIYCYGCKMYVVKSVFNTNNAVETGGGVDASEGASVSHICIIKTHV